MSIMGFDITEYFRLDEHNREVSKSILEPHWEHLQVCALFYEDLLKNSSLENDDHLRIAQVYSLAGCYINLVKSITNVMAGHFSDSSLYARRTIEAVNHCIFMRENTVFAPMWLKTVEEPYRQEFDRGFRSWKDKSNGGGQKLLEKEYPIQRTWKLASNFGPHHNSLLAATQNMIEEKDGRLYIRSNFHEVDSTEKSKWEMLQFYLWNLAVHFATLDWWITHSALDLNLSGEQRSYWRDQTKKFSQCCEKLREPLKKGLGLLP